jgi:hypothetical protein
MLNCHLLDLFHRKLFGFYDQIDFSRLRQAARQGEPQPENVQEVIAATCLDPALAEAAPPEEAEPEGEAEATTTEEAEPTAVKLRPRIRALRCRRFLAILSRLGCEERPGPGSEIVLYRRGGRLARLGHHKRNPHVHPRQVRRILAKLGITLGAFLDAVG